MLPLTSIHRRNLRALAHGISPVVWIGTAGLSESVIHELDRALKSHELIKIKVVGGEREMRETMLEEICQRLGAAPVRLIGRILVIYRPNPDVAAPGVTVGRVSGQSDNAPPRITGSVKNKSRQIKDDTPLSSRPRNSRQSNRKLSRQPSVKNGAGNNMLKANGQQPAQTKRISRPVFHTPLRRPAR